MARVMTTIEVMHPIRILTVYALGYSRDDPGGELIIRGLGGGSPNGRTGGGGMYGKGRACGGARGPFCVFMFVQGEASL